MMVFAIKGFAPWDGDIRPDPNEELVLGANEAKQHGIHLHDRDSRDNRGVYPRVERLQGMGVVG